MKNVTIKKQIQIGITADQWELYTHSSDVGILCIEAACKLNQALEYLLNSGYPRFDARKEMEKLMSKYADLGATDSEPFYVLEKIFDVFYGE